VWAAANAGYGAEVPSSVRSAVRRAAVTDGDAYGRALALNAALALDADGSAVRRAAVALARSILQEGARLKVPRTLSSARGRGARVETLSLAALALSRTGTGAQEVAGLLKRIAQYRGGGGWGGTQATVLALRALATGCGTGETAGEVVLESAGVSLGRFRLRGNGASPMRVDFGAPPTDDVRVRFDGTGRITYTLAATGQLRWGAEEEDTGRKGLNLKTRLSRTSFPVGREVSLEAVLQERGSGSENCMLDLGLGPAFVPVDAALKQLVVDGRIEKYETPPGRLVLYLGALGPGRTQTLRLPLTAVRAGRYTLPPSRAFEYYRPENCAVAKGASVAIASPE
jgi:hypothetical protein